MILSSVTVFLMLMLIDRTVNNTLYDYGLIFSLQWLYPYQIYLSIGMAFIFVNAVAAGLLETTYPREKDGAAGAEKTASTVEGPSSLQVTEQKMETTPKTPKTTPIEKQPQRIDCKFCHFENDPDSVFCEGCGKLLGNARPSPIVTHIYCRFCGTKNRSTAEYCKKCGQLTNR